MFLHQSVILFTKGGGVNPLGQTPPGKTPPLGRHLPPWEDTPWADTPLGQNPPWADTPPPTATAMDGMHPTGMLSCIVVDMLHNIVFLFTPPPPTPLHRYPSVILSTEGISLPTPPKTWDLKEVLPPPKTMGYRLLECFLV